MHAVIVRKIDIAMYLPVNNIMMMMTPAAKDESGGDSSRPAAQVCASSSQTTVLILQLTQSSPKQSSRNIPNTIAIVTSAVLVHPGRLILTITVMATGMKLRR